jgi:hypothetical protein
MWKSKFLLTLFVKSEALQSYLCFCDLPAPLETSWIQENPGRRFWGCTICNSRVSSFMIEAHPLYNLSEFLLIAYTSTYRQKMNSIFTTGWTNQLVQGV